MPLDIKEEAKDCCGGPAWRGGYCPYHRGMVVGFDLAEKEIERLKMELIAAKKILAVVADLLARYEAACGPIDDAEGFAAMNAAATADAMSPVQPKRA